MDANEFIRNSSSHSAEELAPYEEQYVAWSKDGKRILAHAETLAGLYEEVDRKGMTDYVVGFVPGDDLVFT